MTQAQIVRGLQIADDAKRCAANKIPCSVTFIQAPIEQVAAALEYLAGQK